MKKELKTTSTILEDSSIVEVDLAIEPKSEVTR